MERKYPFDIISRNNTISKKQAKSLILKFLKENNCLKEYVDAWKYTQYTYGDYNGREITIEEIIEYGIEILFRKRYPLNRLFSHIASSFRWTDAEFGLKHPRNFWKKISDKWDNKLFYDVGIIK